MSEQIPGGEYVEPDTTSPTAPGKIGRDVDLPARVPGLEKVRVDYSAMMSITPLMTPPTGASRELLLQHIDVLQERLRHYGYMEPGFFGDLTDAGLVRDKPRATQRLHRRHGTGPDATGTGYDHVYALGDIGARPDYDPIVIATGHGEHELPTGLDYPLTGYATPWSRAELVMPDDKEGTAQTGRADVSDTGTDDRDTTDSGSDG